MKSLLKKSLFILILILFGCERNERGLVVGKIQNAAKLATTEFTIDKVVYGTKSKNAAWIFKLNEAKFLAYSQAKIKAGIDLDQIKEKDIKIDLIRKKISVALPPVKIINFSYPAESFRKDTLISGDAFLNKISLEDQEKYFMDAEADIRNNLDKMGIRETTERNTRKLFEGMLKTLGYTEIYISFKQEKKLIETINPDKQ